MPIVFAALTPHPPVLMPEIGGDHLKKLSKTQAAMRQLEKAMYVTKPESVILLSSHGTILSDSFSINLSVNYEADFKEFGDFSIKLTFRSDAMTIQNIRAGDETQKTVPLVLSSSEKLDYGFSVPLAYLLAHAKDLPIIPITYSGLSYQQHYEFGQFLSDRLAQLSKRFAVIASGDLSHKLTKDAPEGFSPQAKQYDQKFLKLLEAKDVKGLISLDPKMVNEVSETALRAVLVMLGILGEMKFEPKLLSYEGPFGVGYAVMDFELA